jgi:hypothetical protein
MAHSARAPEPEHQVNPYAAPEAPIGEAPPAGPADLAAAEAVRRAHLNHEANIKSVGSLHILGAVLSLLGLAFAALSFFDPVGRARAVATPFFAVYLAFFLINLALGIGLTRLRPWARWAETTLVGLYLALNALTTFGALFMVGPAASPVLFGAAVTWAILGAILWLMLSRKGAMVFSPEYQEIIARTPHIKYKTSFLAKFLLVLILGGLAIAVIMAIFG